ncbi:MAG TPA: transposase [Dehalococcoidia bacterium]|nr:transposase [Dehalococcoidia bacterium]
MAGYDPQIHHRRSIRLPAWDYRERGAYFVTICTHERRCTLIGAGIRSIVLEAWRGIPDHFRYVSVDEFVIMPNHVHGIICIDVGAMASPRPNRVGRGSPSPLRQRQPRGADPGSLGAVIGSFKSHAAYRINGLKGTPGAPVWQRNYYERVIRSDRELERAREYIMDNPRKWAVDKHNPANLADS